MGEQGNQLLADDLDQESEQPAKDVEFGTKLRSVYRVREPILITELPL
jgi:hypothetical protein